MYRSQFGSRQADVVLFAIASVTPVAIDLVGMHRFRVATKTHAIEFYIEFYLADQVKSLVVIVPADSIHEADAIDQADAEFGAKLKCPIQPYLV
jgi:hypothetical protein